MTVDTIFNPEQIRAIQTDELSAISTLTLPEIQARIDEYQRVSREAYLRMGKASEELHRRLSEKSNDELDEIVEKVPAAERILRDRKGYNVKPKAPTKKERIIHKAKMESKDNPLMKQLLAELMAPKKG